MLSLDCTVDSVKLNHRISEQFQAKTEMTPGDIVQATLLVLGGLSQAFLHEEEQNGDVMFSSRKFQAEIL